MKFHVTFSFLLINIVSVFSVYLKNAEIGEANLEPLENIYSAHIPKFLQPLNLTAGELKLFAGHSFKLIKTKCPAVSQERLDLISKYITKHISRSNPTPGTSPAFKELLASISSCTEHELTEEEKSKRDMSFFQFFFHPINNFRNFFSSADTTKDSTEGPSLATTTGIFPDTISLDAPSESVQEINPIEGDDNFSSIGKADDDNENVSAPAANPDVVVDNNAPNSPFIRIFYTATSNADELAPWNPMRWIGGVFRAMRNLISGIFGTEGATTTSTETPVFRAKRDVESGKAPPVELVQLREPNLSENAAAPVIPLKGRDAFIALIDNLCRIYCSECTGNDQIRNFKAAAKELLQLILTDTTGIQLASKHFLEPDFLQSLNDC